MADQDGIGRIVVEGPPGFVRTTHVAETAAEFQIEFPLERNRLAMPQRPDDAVIVGAGEQVGWRVGRTHVCIAAAYRSARDCGIKSGCRSECLLQIIDNVIGVFDSDGHSNVFWNNTGLLLFFGRELLVRCTGRVNHQRLCITDVGQV